MLCGGLSPFPLRFGGGNKRLKALVDSLGRQRGTAYDTTQPSNVYAMDMAAARALNAAWATNVRLGYLWDPMRTPVLDRWERMLGLPVAPSDTERDRRLRLKATFDRIGRAVTETSLATQLAAALGDAFVAVEYLSTPAVYSTSPWHSTFAHVLIRVQQPASWSASDFYRAVGKVFPIMDAQAPAWVYWNWYRPGPMHVNVSGGPSAGGFYLDDPHNLGEEVFST